MEKADDLDRNAISVTTQIGNTEIALRCSISTL